MRRLVLIPEGWPCELRECPPGLFLYQDNVCFKTEYGAMEPAGPRNVPGPELRWTCGMRTREHIVAYCCATKGCGQPAVAKDRGKWRCAAHRRDA